jgi:enoyl-CoA hydratase
LVNEVTQDGTHFERALAVATGMANCSPLSIQLTKRAINRGFDISGMRQALLAAIDAATLIESNVRPENAEFERLRTTQGMQAALAWRNSQQASAVA